METDFLWKSCKLIRLTKQHTRSEDKCAKISYISSRRNWHSMDLLDDPTIANKFTDSTKGVLQEDSEEKKIRNWRNCGDI